MLYKILYMNFDQSGNVTFETEASIPQANNKPVSSASLYAGIIKLSGGAITDEKSARLVCIGVIAFSCLLIPYLVSLSLQHREVKIVAPAGYEVVYPKNTPPRLQIKK